MGKRNYFRNQDDRYNAPEILETQYKIGRSSFFEVELTLAEQDQTLGNTSSSSPISIAALGLEGSSGSGGQRIGCPEENQYIWVNKDKDLKYVTAIRAKSLLKNRREYFLYNPISRHFNKLIKATKIENIAILKCITSNSNIEFRCSKSHKIIRNTSDIKGQSLMHHIQGTEMLTVKRLIDKFKVANYTLFTDIILKMQLDGIGNCIEIELENEFIYALGTDKNNMSLGHNFKQQDEL